jgi:hypothetical protein
VDYMLAADRTNHLWASGDFLPAICSGVGGESVQAPPMTVSTKQHLQTMDANVSVTLGEMDAIELTSWSILRLRVKVR